MTDHTKIKTIVQLRKHLLRFGNVLALKEGHVFTVLVQKRENFPSLSSLNIYQEILGAVVTYTQKTYPIIEVATNDEDFFLIVLKPQGK